MPIYTFTQQAARFADVHGITRCAGDDENNVGGAARERSLWAGKRDNASASLIIGQVLHLAASQRKVPAVSQLFLCFRRLLTSKSLRFEGRR